MKKIAYVLMSLLTVATLLSCKNETEKMLLRPTLQQKPSATLLHKVRKCLWLRLNLPSKGCPALWDVPKKLKANWPKWMG